VPAGDVEVASRPFPARMITRREELPSSSVKGWTASLCAT
jgi:hypothetical protein